MFRVLKGLLCGMWIPPGWTFFLEFWYFAYRENYKWLDELFMLS